MILKRLFVWGVAVSFLTSIAYLIWDRIPEVDSDPANAPVDTIMVVGATTVPLTTEVVNPAGIVFLPDSNTYLVSTDDRVLVELTPDFLHVISFRTIPNSPLSIGDTEGVTYLGDGSAAVIGENGVVILVERDGKGWQETDRFAIPSFRNGTQLGSATFDLRTETIYTAQKMGEKILYKIDLNNRTVEVIPMKLGPMVKERTGRTWQEFTISGLQIYQDRLYAISEAYSSLLVFNTEGIVEEIRGLEGINESSGITIREGKLTLLGDAEGYLPDPPIYLLHEPG